jgi:hypothetical protein
LSWARDSTRAADDEGALYTEPAPRHPPDPDAPPGAHHGPDNQLRDEQERIASVILDQIGGCRLVTEEMTDQHGNDAPGQDDVWESMLSPPMSLEIVDQRNKKRR